MIRLVLVGQLWFAILLTFVGWCWFIGYAAEWGSGSDPSVEGLLWGIGVAATVLICGLVVLALFASGKAWDAYQASKKVPPQPMIDMAALRDRHSD